MAAERSQRGDSPPALPIREGAVSIRDNKNFFIIVIDDIGRAGKSLLESGCVLIC
jgi:hypothetical protein